MATRFTVKTVADKGADSLRAAIAAAQDGDTIRFAPSLNDKNQQQPGTQSLQAREAVMFNGQDQGLNEKVVTLDDYENLFHACEVISKSGDGSPRHT